MKRNNYVAVAALLLVGLLLVPSSHFAETNDSVPVFSDGLKVQMEQAGPNELVTVIVKMRGTADLDPIRGQRTLVFSELRQYAANSQRSLVSDLQSLSGTGQVGVIRQFWIDNIVLVQATVDVINDIATRADVSKVFENFTVTRPPRPELPDGPDRAALQQPWDSIDHIGAKDVWTAYGFTGTGIRAGGLDTGVDINHPDIAGKMVTNNATDPTYPGGWAEFDSNGNPIPGSVPHDSDQHGTHTTGTMLGGNASGFDIGVAPGANLMHGLVIPGGSGSFAQVAGGMEWIIDPDGNPITDDGAQLVNMSLGGTGTHDAMIAPTDNMVAADVFPSFSIGNSGPGTSSTGSPGNVPSAYGVGATNSSDVIASFSGRGPVTWDTPPYVGTWIKPDISAPGVNIYSSVPGGTWQSAGWDGTSMAAPHVAGTVALIRQANPTLLVSDIKLLLEQTALDLGTAGMDNDYGHGRVNTFAAVSAALAGIGTLQGTVYSSAGGKLQGVLVFVTDTGQRVFSDATGNYSIKLVAGSHTLDYSAFGYDTETVTVTIDADVTHTQDVTLNQLPSGYIAGNVTDAGTGAGIAADVNVYYLGQVVRTTTCDATTGAYTLTLPVGSYDVVFNPPFPYPRKSHLGVAVAEAATTPLDVVLSPAQVLLVDDDEGGSFETYFEDAIMTAGRSYLRVETAPTAAEMATFEAVVWFTGNNYTATLSAADQAALTAYLDGGGRLFITGQDIGYDINGDAFYADYLHAAYVQDDVELGAVLGNNVSPVGFGFAFDIQGGSGANNQAYPSEIDVLAPALPAYFYDPSVPAAAVTTGVTKDVVVGGDGIEASGAAGLSMDSGVYRLVYFSFGFEGIAGATTRTEVMDRVLDWLQGFPEITHEPLGDTEDTEHPYEVTAIITSDYFALDPMSFAVVYDIGTGNGTLPMTATGNPDEYHAYIPAQSAETDVYYYITASDVEGHTSTHPLGAPINRHMFKVGADDEPPSLAHIPYRDTNDLTGPYCLTALASDNIGVESVYLVFRKNGGMMHRAEMTGADGAYGACIPGPSDVGDIYEYAILVMDASYSGLVTRFPETGYHGFEIVEEFVWDFELDDGGFTEAGGVWEWGSPTSGPGAAHSGVNVWGTVLDGDYPSSSDATLDVPAITLAADKPYALFSFWHWYNMENRYDGGNVKISTDGGLTFDIVTPVGDYDDTARSGNAGIPNEPCFTNNHGAWEQEIFDLSAYTGQSIVLRFHFGSDGSVNRPGWFIDDANLRSTDVDDVPPVISNVDVPSSTFDTVGPYTVTATASDLLSGLATVSLFYTIDDGMSWTEMAMTPAGGNDWEADIPGQTNGTRIGLYVKAADNNANETFSPEYEFAILPSADILVMVSSSSVGVTLDDFRNALEANGHEADYWNLASQGSEVLTYLDLYETVVLDERGSMLTSEQTAYASFLSGGGTGGKKGFFVLGRDLGYYSSTRPFISEWFRADYVQDNPGYRELTGEPGDPIGQGEVFVISGSYPDETQRSTTNPGGEIVYRFTGEGTLALSRDELAETYDKDGKEWDGVMPHAPKSLDAAAGIRYNGDSYRSVYFTFNFDYIQELSRRATIIDRVVRWMDAPEIVHVPLSDTEDTLSAYVATAEIHSDDLDASRVNLHYDVGDGWVALVMTTTGNPDEYTASIPAQLYGTTVNYYLSAANNDGNTAYDPAAAPADWHSFEVTADNTPPEIVHTPITMHSDLAGPYPVTANVTDNVGVDPSGVTLTYRKNGGATTTVTMLNTSGDEYTASILGPSAYGDVYEYYIIAHDLAAVPNSAREPATGWHAFEIVDFFAWDFEANDGGFTAGGPDWQWGAPTTGPGSAYSGVNAWATQLGGNYSASSNSTLDTPPIVVPSGEAYATLSFWQWYYNETNYDGGNVKISTDGGATWVILTPDIGYNGTATSGNAAIPGEPCFTGYNNDEWHQASFDLTPYRGMAVIIRLHFGSDSSVQRVGWYIDDMRIEGVADTAGPVFANVSTPTGTFDEIGPYTVSADVVDALSGLASVDMFYSTNGGATWTMVAMTNTSGDTYSGDIPGQSSGTRIRIYMEAADNTSNSTLDPDGAPATYYEFGIMPSGDYLVLLGGASHTDPVVFQQAFAAIGRTADTWDWDDLGVPTVAILQQYDAVIVDESWYLDTAQQDTLGAFLSTAGPSLNQIFFLGRDLSFGTTAQPWMEQFTGSAYVKDDPSWRELTSTPGDPIGNDEVFTISGSYPDELKLSTTYPGAAGVYTYSALGSSAEIYESPQEHREFYEKYGKEWDPRLWPLAPTGPDSLAAVRFVQTTFATVYFSFNFNYIQESTRQAAILERVLDWLDVAVVSNDATASVAPAETPNAPNQLVLGQNYPNPFNPVTRITIGVPNGHVDNVSLKVYNVRGQLVTTLFEGKRGPGYHTFQWNGMNSSGHGVSTGVYFARVVSGTTVLTKKMLMLK